MTAEEALGGDRFPADVVSQMRLLEIEYLGFDNRIHQGQIVVHRDLAEETEAIFAEVMEAGFPIEKMVPISVYGWDDDASVLDNNTSGFNYRRTQGPGTSGKVLSMHAYGRAIDINPYQNPFLDASGKGMTQYDPAAKGAITRDSAITKIFKKHGWKWGGDWANTKDYQHFYKP